jgi:hypothetical protein
MGAASTQGNVLRMSPKGSFASAGPSEQFAFGGGSAIISLAFTFNDSMISVRSPNGLT